MLRFSLAGRSPGLVLSRIRARNMMMLALQGAADDVRWNVDPHGVASATLDRTKALNALSHGMVARLASLYGAWDVDPAVRCVVLKGEGDRAFCAGGDVRALIADNDEAMRFFRDEYTLNHLIATLRPCHVALMDGITMGGGVGLSVHGMFRVATERTVWAMPETGIGFFPDVGGSYFLPRLPGNLGMHLALSGARLKGAEVKAAGIATHVVPSASLEDIEKRISALGEGAGDRDTLDTLLRGFEADGGSDGAAALAAALPAINRCYGQPTIEGIVEAVEAEAGAGEEWAVAAAKGLREAAPVSLAVTHRQVLEGAGMDLASCLQMELRIASRFGTTGSFREGVRALLVDKDGSPKWDPPTLAGVTGAEVDRYFQPLPPGEELTLPPRARL